MALELEAVVYPQDPFTYNSCKDFYLLAGGGGWGNDYYFDQEDEDQADLLGNILNNNIVQQAGGGAHANNCNWDYSSPSVMQNAKEWGPNYSSPEACTGAGGFPHSMESVPTDTTTTSITTGSRRKRRRTRSTKNKEEIENQRMTHIAVERNRRKQMNEYLAVLRSLMPSSYVQRGDQASIVGGAINFVKELEQLLQSMEAHKRIQQPDITCSPFAEFFTFPQYSTGAAQCNNSPPVPMTDSVADIEVSMVETHANLKILSKKRPRQLLKLVAGFQSLRLTVLHLNLTTLDEMVLYTISVKVEEGCQLNTVDDIAAAVNQTLSRIQEEASSSC